MKPFRPATHCGSTYPAGATCVLPNPNGKTLVGLIQEPGKIDIDTLCFRSQMLPHKAAGILLNLEYNGVVRSLPGKVNALN